MKREYSKNGARRNNLGTFNHDIRKKAEMPRKTTWLNISFLSFHNFGKESKSRAPYLNFRILSQIDLREEKEIHL